MLDVIKVFITKVCQHFNFQFFLAFTPSDIHFHTGGSKYVYK